MQGRDLIILGLQSEGPAGPEMGPLSLGLHIPKGLASPLPNGTRLSAPSSPSGSRERPLLILQSTNTCLFKNIIHRENDKK